MGNLIRLSCQGPRFPDFREVGLEKTFKFLIGTAILFLISEPSYWVEEGRDFLSTRGYTPLSFQKYGIESTEANPEPDQFEISRIPFDLVCIGREQPYISKGDLAFSI